MSDPPAFDLTIEPWIPVVDLDGGVRELSPVEVVAQAGRLASIGGELPTTGFALTRLLLAVLHRAVGGPADRTDWRELWEGGDLPADDVARYLATWRHRFDLFHPETPFLQVADLVTAKRETSGLEKLIADVPNGHPFFTARAGLGVRRIDPAEAARWLVHAQAFDPSGIKSGAVGDDRVKGGKGYPIGIAWAGNLGGILLQGATLRDTLLLNLLPYDDYDLDLHWGQPSADRPVWERDPLTAAPEQPRGVPRHRPNGPADLYTWPSRRIRLAGEAGDVTGVLIANGDPLSVQNRQDLEPMTAWRRSQAQEKKLGWPLVYMPREHSVERAFWRGLAALLPAATRSMQGGEGARTLSPAVISWLAAVQQDGLLPVDYAVRARAVGIVYGSNNSVVDELIDDELSLSIAVLQAQNRALGQQAVEAVAASEKGVQALGKLAANLANAAGGDGEGPRDRATELAFAALDSPFRRWVAGLRSDSDLLDVQADWHRQVRRIVRGLGDELIAQSSEAAWKGRTVNKRHVDSALADVFFAADLKAAVAPAYPQPTVRAEENA